jgi:chromosome segregation ATPase
MDVNFLNAYTEVLTENLDAVLKQNFLLQTRIKVSEKNSNENEKQELQRKVEVLIKENEEFRTALLSKDREISNLVPHKDRSFQFDNVVNEKNRIQESLNQTLQKVSSLESEINTKTTLLSEKQTKLQELESELSSLKEELQKLKPVSISDVLDVKTKKMKTSEQPKIERGGVF